MSEDVLMKIKLKGKSATIQKFCIFVILMLLVWRIDALLLGSACLFSLRLLSLASGSPVSCLWNCLGMRKLRKLPASQSRTAFSMVSLIIGVTLGVLALTSTLLPWVIAERVEPLIETRAGTFNVGRYHALTGSTL